MESTQAYPSGGSLHRLSLCMIVKNEGITLGPCLDSVKDVVDEMIIVDTGSIDETISIASQFGAKVIQHKWQNDFAEARNISLDHATGQWVLFLDADERLDRDSISILKEIITNNDAAEGYRFTFINYIDDGSSTITSSLFRLFRNKGYRFTGKIHEQIELEVAKNGVIKDVPISIHHFGYLSNIQAAKDKSSRNISMLQAELQLAPNDPYLRFQFGSSLGIMGKHLEAIQEFTEVYNCYKGMDPATWPAFATHSIYLMSKSFYFLGQYHQALKWSEWAMTRWRITELYYQHGNIQHKLRQHADAISTLLRCQDRKECNSTSFQTVPGTGSYLAMLNIGKIYEFMGDIESAREWYFKSFENYRDHPDTVYRLSRLISDSETLIALSRLIEKRHLMEAFCFGCAESGHELTTDILNRLEKDGMTQMSKAARLRYLGRRGETGEQIRLLKTFQDEFPLLIEFLIALNRHDMSAVSNLVQRLRIFKADAEAVIDVTRGNCRPINANLITLAIDFSLRFIFDSSLSAMPEDQQDEAILEAKRAWKQKYDLAHTKSTCGVAYDLKTERAIQSNDTFEAREFLEKAFGHGSTVTRHILKMELQRITEDLNGFESTLEVALNEYPGSLLLRKTAKYFLNHETSKITWKSNLFQ